MSTFFTTLWTSILKRAALERTFLSYVRTASAFALFGVTAAQLFRLEGSISPSDVSTFFHLGRPIGAAAEGVAILIVLFGAYRCWSQQQKLLTGHVKARGWEILSIGGLAFAVSFLFNFVCKSIYEVLADCISDFVYGARLCCGRYRQWKSRLNAVERKLDSSQVLLCSSSFTEI